jgi:hypothetical protein
MLEAPLVDELMPEEDEPMRGIELSMPLHALSAATQMAERISFFMKIPFDDLSGTAILF